MRFLSVIGILFLLSACTTSSDDMSRDGGLGTTDRAPISGLEGYDVEQMSGPEAGTQQDFVVNIGDRIFFGYDQYDLSPSARDVVGKQAEWLNMHPNLTITVEGHCDERGTREYNLALGDKRANAVQNYLTALGVSSSRINVISYGKERPAVLGADTAAWSQNRRAVTVIE